MKHVNTLAKVSKNEKAINQHNLSNKYGNVVNHHRVVVKAVPTFDGGCHFEVVSR